MCLYACIPTQADAPPTLKDRLVWLVGGGVGVVAFLLYLTTASREYAEKQAVLRATQDLRRLRKRAQDTAGQVGVSTRLVRAAGRMELQCRLVTPAEPTPGAPVVLLAGTAGVFVCVCEWLWDGSVFSVWVCV